MSEPGVELHNEPVIPLPLNCPFKYLDSARLICWSDQRKESESVRGLGGDRGSAPLRRSWWPCREYPRIPVIFLMPRTGLSGLVWSTDLSTEWGLSKHSTGPSPVARWTPGSTLSAERLLCLHVYSVLLTSLIWVVNHYWANADGHGHYFRVFLGGFVYCG